MCLTARDNSKQVENMLKNKNQDPFRNLEKKTCTESIFLHFSEQLHMETSAMQVGGVGYGISMGGLAVVVGWDGGYVGGVCGDKSGRVLTT